MLPLGAKVGGTSEAAGTLPQDLRRDFSAVDYAEAMRRAREIVPILRERLQRSREEELETALRELVAIAEDRWRRS